MNPTLGIVIVVILVTVIIGAFVYVMWDISKAGTQDKNE